MAQYLKIIDNQNLIHFLYLIKYNYYMELHLNLRLILNRLNTLKIISYIN